MIIDDRAGGDLRSALGTSWRLVTDGVMGGVSEGRLKPGRHLDRPCLRLEGAVSTANNGGFIQMSLDLADGGTFDANGFAGLRLTVAGNGERYNLHLKTADLWFPWQSYRAGFDTGQEWREVRLPFADFQAYRTSSRFDPARLVRIGLLAIGRDFQAELCLADIAFYRENGSGRDGP